VVKCQKIGVDYALLQQGFALGLLHRYPEKTEVLRSLTKEYPQSDYVDDALYEIARAELQQNRPQEAIAVYQALLQDHPTSNYAAKT
jgi:TolA-binding protein